jgi:hypothetical protein
MTSDDFLKKRSYEEAQIKLLQDYSDEPAVIKKEFVPEYLKQQLKAVHKP